MVSSGSNNHTLPNSEVLFFDVFGKLIKTYKVTNNIEKINLEGFTKGIYFLKLKSDNQLTKENKIIIQ